MRGIIAKTIVYPMKGLHGIETPNRGLEAHTRLGVVGDRNFAVFRKGGDAPNEWKPKGQFHVCMNTEMMATPHGLAEADLDDRFRPKTDVVRKIYEERGALHSETQLVDTGGRWHIADTNKPYVSFLNLASVEKLSDETGMFIDPRRFRMNVWVDGLPPFCELDYVKEFANIDAHPMQAHGVRLGIDDLCERCRAIEQSPESGEWNLDLLDMLESSLKSRKYEGSPHRGKFAVMGWLAIPQNNDCIRVGHQVTFG